MAKTERAFLEGEGFHPEKNYWYNCNKTRKYGFLGVFLAPKASLELCILSVFSEKLKRFQKNFQKMKEISKQSKQFQTKSKKFKEISKESEIN